MTIRSGVLALSLAAVLAMPGVAQSRSLDSDSAHKGPAGVPSLALVKAGYLTVGTDATYPPMESTDPRTHQFVGADIDIGRALARAMGLKGAIFKNNSFDTIIPALQRGNFDIVMSSMSDTPKRRKQIAFVDYMRASESIVVKANSSIRGDSYAAVCGHAVSVQSGTTEFDGLTAANKKCSSKIDIKQFKDDTAAFQAFASGHADAYTGDLPVCALYVKTHNGSLRLAGKAFSAGGNYGIGISLRAKSLRVAVKKGLAKLRANGAYSRILAKWDVGGASF